MTVFMGRGRMTTIRTNSRWRGLYAPFPVACRMV
jgi:hypothetical protein